jgi:large subunit ribosomal protein L4
MIELPIYNVEGQQIDTVNVEESTFGSIIRRKLLKQAVVMYHANKRQGTVATKSRGMVEGSTRKLFAQKGTGRARMGTIRTNVRRGGGMAFAKVPRDFSKKMPNKARRLARDSAILSKMLAGTFYIVDGLSVEQPKTKSIVVLLNALKLQKSCLIGTGAYDKNIYLSARNIEKVSVMPVDEFNAYDVLKPKAILVDKAGFERLLTIATGSNAEATA